MNVPVTPGSVIRSKESRWNRPGRMDATQKCHTWVRAWISTVARCLFRKLRHAERLMQSIAVFLIRVYRVAFAPLKVMFGVQGCCRYTPSCSTYTEEAICTH